MLPRIQGKRGAAKVQRLDGLNILARLQDLGREGLLGEVELAASRVEQSQDRSLHDHRCQVRRIRQVGQLGDGLQRLIPPPEQDADGDAGRNELGLPPLVADPAGECQASLDEVLDLLVASLRVE